MTSERSDDSSIREVCRLFGVTPRTLRFYEQKGLIAPKRVSRVRYYGPADCDRLTKIFALRKFGLTLQEIDFTLKFPGEGPLGLSRKFCEVVMARMQDRKAEIEAALVTLEAMLDRPGQE